MVENEDGVLVWEDVQHMQPINPANKPKPINLANKPNQLTEPTKTASPASSAEHTEGQQCHHVTSVSCVCAEAHLCEHSQSSQSIEPNNLANQLSYVAKPENIAGPAVQCTNTASHHPTSASFVCAGFPKCEYLSSQHDDSCTATDTNLYTASRKLPTLEVSCVCTACHPLHPFSLVCPMCDKYEYILR